ncbi:MAG: hypothetical protein QNJ74_15400 [Trichodesmium sp. MO_231.B1]|nr:hypothetical protein [Trichodesmium sp. MO_231.B1]
MNCSGIFAVIDDGLVGLVIVGKVYNRWKSKVKRLSRVCDGILNCIFQNLYSCGCHAPLE